MAADLKPTSSKDTVSLEDLVREQAMQSGLDPAGSETAIDEVLAVEDPTFVAALEELKGKGTAPPEADAVIDTDLESLVQEAKAEKAAKGRKRFKLYFVVWPKRKLANVAAALKTVGPWLIATAIPASKAGAAKSWQGVQSGVGYSVRNIKSGQGRFSKLPRSSKTLVFLVLIFALGAVAMAKIAITGSFLPSLERDFLNSFASRADQSFDIGKDEPWEDLNDPLLHPEHIVLVERLIANLHAAGDGSNPMALIDLYVEAGSQDAAIEIKDRDAEVRDMVLRTLEQMSYEELATDAGKNKLKVFIRKNLNDMISRGRVRRVFYKSIVLKP